jgi:dTDP-4-amino-4,6-dideoxygalactose transaminase
LSTHSTRYSPDAPLRLSRSILGPREAEATSRVLLDDGYLGMGREVQSFEVEVADFIGVPATHVTSVSSGTAALQLAVEAIVAPGCEVLVQSFTFVASYQAITAAGAVPVSCEIDPSTGTIDLRDAEGRITDKTRAIMPVHYASNMGDLDAIYDFARSHGLRVIEDAAHSFGCDYGSQKIGAIGDVSCFSFDGIKNITSGEGGAVITGDQEVTARIQDSRLLGVEKDTEKRQVGQRSWEFDVSRQGYRYHMSNLFAAIGRVQLQRLMSEFAPQRIKLAGRYREILGQQQGVRLLEAKLGAIIPHIQPICVLHGKRDVLRDALEAEHIQTGVHYKPNHLLTKYGAGSPALPVTEQLYEEILSLPLHPGVSTDDVEYVCDVVRRVLC